MREWLAQVGGWRAALLPAPDATSDGREPREHAVLGEFMVPTRRAPTRRQPPAYHFDHHSGPSARNREK